MSWRDHEYEIELGIELPETPVSTGEDWIDDCEEDDVFDLKPEYFMSKNQKIVNLSLQKKHYLKFSRPKRISS